MTRPVSAHWRPAVKRHPLLRQTLSGMALAVAAVLVAQWIAGYFCLWSWHVNPRLATPLTIARYAYYYGHSSSVRRRLILSSTGGLGLVAATAILLLRRKRRALHGDAQFARRGEIVRAGLFSPFGIILSRRGRRLLRLPGQQGVAVIARSRSGKTAGIVIPNLLDWPDSVICVDPKKENYTVTAGHRARMGHAVYLFDPFSESRQTARWNPLGYIPDDPLLRVNGLQRIADMLYAETPGVDPFWSASARTLFLGIGLYVFETPSLPKTIGQILRLGMASDDEGFGHHWKRLIEGRSAGRFPLSSECVRALCDVIDLAPVTASSIRKTFTSRLDLWLNPILDWATSENDFDLRKLRVEPIDIFVGVLLEDLHRLRPVLSLFFQQAIALQTRELPENNPRLERQVMFLLDEFTSLGKIPIIAEAIAFLSGYNIRVVLVIQARSQLREVYGPNAAETILRNLAARVVFGADDYADAREISEELGTMTVKVKSVSKPAFGLATKSSRQRNISVSEQRRPLMLPQEVQSMGKDQAIVFYEGIRPIRCRKIRYFADWRFRARLLPPPTQAAPGGLVLRTRTPTPPEPSQTPEVPSGDSLIPQTLVVREREVCLADVQRLEFLALADFSDKMKNLKFTHAGERPTDSELEADVKQFLAAMR
jgi:type IV secretion system protein VirD4